MNSETKTLSRQELYDKIWSTPIHKLAKEFCLSDVGLAKLCKRHAIPRPGRGYWRRTETGQKVRRTPLPVLKDPSREIINIVIQEKPPWQGPSPYVNAPAIPFPPEEKPITHPFALRTEKRLARSKKKDQKGLLIPRTGVVTHVSVTAETLPRALRILDVLFTALPEHGCTLRWPREQNANLSVIVDDEELSFSISEIIKGKVHVLTRAEQNRQKSESWWSPPYLDFQPTGRLRLKIESEAGRYLRHHWSDGKRQRLENFLGQFVAGLKATATAVKEDRANRIRWEQERQEQAKRDAELRRQREEYARKAELTVKLARNWEESRLMGDFLAAFEGAIKNANLTDEQQTEANTMLAWTKQHAAYLNPLTDVPWMLGEFKRAIDPYGYLRRGAAGP